MELGHSSKQSPAVTVKATTKSPAQYEMESRLLKALREKDEVIKSLRRTKSYNEEEIHELKNYIVEGKVRDRTRAKMMQEKAATIEHFRSFEPLALESEELKSRIADLEKENENFKTKLVDFNQLREENSSLFSENKKIQENNNILEEKCKNLNSKLGDQKELMEKNEDLNTQLSLSEKHRGEIELELVNQIDQNRQLLTANEFYQEQLANTKHISVQYESGGNLATSFLFSNCPTPAFQNFSLIYELQSRQNLEEEIFRTDQELVSRNNQLENEKLKVENLKLHKELEILKSNVPLDAELVQLKDELSPVKIQATSTNNKLKKEMDSGCAPYDDNKIVKEDSLVRQFKCPDCSKTWKTRSRLITHMRVHSDVRMYQCDKCEKSYKHKDKLAKHQQKHSDIQCKECGADITNHTQVTHKH